MTLQDLQALGFQQTPDGRWFLPYDKTGLGYLTSINSPADMTPQWGQDANGLWGMQTPAMSYYGKNEQGVEAPYSTLDEALASIDQSANPYVGLSTGGRTEGYNYIFPGSNRGTIGGQQGFYVDPNQLLQAKINSNTGSGWNDVRDFLKTSVGLYFGAQGLGGALEGAGAGSGTAGSGAADLGAGGTDYAAYEAAGGNAAYGVPSGAGGTLAGGGTTAAGGVAGGGGTAAGGGAAGTGTATGSGGGLTLDQALKAGGLLATLAAAGSKQKTGTTTTTQVNDPWSAQQPYLQSLFQNAAGLYGMSGMSPETIAALQRQSQRAMAGQSLTEAGQREFGKTIAGDYLRPESNPYLQSTLDNAMNQVQARVSGTFGTRGGNNYGSSAHQEWLGRNLMEAASPLLSQNYQTERGRQLNAAQIAPSLAYADIAPLAQVGASKEAYPWDQLARYQGAISGNYGGTSQTTSPYFKANPYLNALGAGIAGVGLYGMGQQAGLWGNMAGNTATTNPYTGNYGSGLSSSGASGWGYGSWGP